MTTKLSLEMDDKTHYKFKQFCLKKDISMKDAMNIAISMILRNQVRLNKKNKS